MADEPTLRWPDEPLTDGDIWCTPPRRPDIPLIARACDDPEIARWLPVPQPYTEADAEAFVSSRPAAAADGEELTFAVRDRGRDLVGMVALHAARTRDGELEIGYWVAPWARGLGIAAKATRLVAAYGFETLKPRRIELLIALGNTASLTAARRAGAVEEGVRRAGLELRDQTYDVWVLSLVPSDLLS